MSFDWTCPHCGHAQSVVEGKFDSSPSHIYIEGLAEGSVSIAKRAYGCANGRCKMLTLSLWVQQDHGPNHGFQLKSGGAGALGVVSGSVVAVLPRSTAKSQPAYIPAPLREDYLEACLVRDLSPKAAATLVRRCLQGMIRDFTGISKGRLIDEIRALRSAVEDGRAPDGVSHDSINAIDQVRDIGNIGAHMEKDINLIVDVEAGEAQMLIELVEMLFDEWYVARDRRQERLRAIAQLATEKKDFLAKQKSEIGGKVDTSSQTSSPAS